MQGILKLSEKWWFGAMVGTLTVLAIFALAMTIGVSFEAGGVVVSLDPNETFGLQVSFQEHH